MVWIALIEISFIGEASKLASVSVIDTLHI